MQQSEDDLFTIQGTASLCMNQEQNMQSRPDTRTSHDIATTPAEDMEKSETSTEEDRRLRKLNIQVNQLTNDVELSRQALKRKNTTTPEIQNRARKTLERQRQ